MNSCSSWNDFFCPSVSCSTDVEQEGQEYVILVVLGETTVSWLANLRCGLIGCLLQDNSNNNEIINNFITNCQNIGIQLFGSLNNVIADNFIGNMSADGINLHLGCHNKTVINNEINILVNNDYSKNVLYKYDCC